MGDTHSEQNTKRVRFCASHNLTFWTENEYPPPPIGPPKMKITTTIPMKRLDATAAQYLHATVTDAIPPGAVMVLRKRPDGAFEIVVIVQRQDATDTILLASFLDPEIVDAIRDEAIAGVVMNAKPKRSRKPKVQTDTLIRSTKGD